MEKKAESQSISAQLTYLKDYLNNNIKEQGDNEKITPDSTKKTSTILKKYNANCSIDSIKEVCGKAWLDINYLIHNNKTFGPEVECSSQEYFKILKSVITEIDKELPKAQKIDRYINGIINTTFDDPELKNALIKNAITVATILVVGDKEKHNSDKEEYTFTGESR